MTDHVLALARIVQHLARQAAPGMHDEALDKLLIELDPAEKKKHDERLAAEKLAGGHHAGGAQPHEKSWPTEEVQSASVQRRHDLSTPAKGGSH